MHLLFIKQQVYCGNQKPELDSIVRVQRPMCIHEFVNKIFLINKRIHLYVLFQISNWSVTKWDLN